MFGVSGKYILGFLWTLPTSILGWIFFGIAGLFGNIDSVRVTKELIFIWDLNEESRFCKKLFVKRGWAGFSIGNNVILLDYSKDSRYSRTVKHEKRHCIQQYKLGVFFFLVYLLSSILEYLMGRHGYYDNIFEVDARKFAGQKVYIPKSEWPDGPDDRWSWW